MSRVIPIALSLAAVATAFICTPATAQQRNDAGLGAVKRFFDATARTPTGNVRLTGVAYVNGKSYVGGDAVGQVATTYEFDSTGKLTNSFNTPVTVGTDDLADDGTSIIAATPAGVSVYTTMGVLTNNVVANAGVQTISQPLTGPAFTTLGRFRGVAYNPGGNGGKGSLYVSNAGAGPIIEIDLTGVVLNTFANQGWDATGLAWDPRTGNLWCLNKTNTTDIMELDITKGLQPTGVSFPERWSNQAFRGGIDGVPGGDKGSYPSDFDLAVLNRLNGPDWLVYHRIHLHNGILGTDEAFMEGSVNSTTLTRGNAGDLGTIKASDTVRWRVDAGTSKSAGLPAFTLISAGPDAGRDAVTPFIPELTILSPFSIPSSGAVLLLPGVVGTPALSAVIPSNALSCFQLVRFQTAYLDLSAPGPFSLIATNEMWANWSDETSCDIVVEAVGANSFNANRTSGFFRVIQTGFLPITEITFDWMQCRNPAQFNIRFDTNNPTMADFFDAGNSTTVGCTGTYRNGSDAAVGLVYDNLNNPANACAPNANSGFIATNQYGRTLGDFRTLKFRFTKFIGGTKSTPLIFEFDCDTDGGIGTDGASMAGCVIKIQFAGGAIEMVSELRVDPNTGQRSVAGF